MNYMKRRVSLLLCMLMVFTTIFTAAPVEMQAANTVYTLNNSLGNGNYDVIIYKGMKDLYIGDFVSGYKITNPGTSKEEYTYYSNVSTQKNVTYKSSKKEVATVNSKGKITTKDTGTTTITVKYQGQTSKIKLKVVSKKTYDKEIDAYTYVNASSVEEAAKKFLDKTGTDPKITKDNRYKLLTAYANYQTNLGYTSIFTYDAKKQTYVTKYYIYSPSAARAMTAYNKIATYCEKYNPFSTRSGKCFEIKSISGKGKTITVNLKKNVTEDQIFGAQAQFDWDTELKQVKTYTFPIVVKNTSTGYEYYAIASVTQGKSKMTITLKNAKLTKGKKYELVAKTATGRGGSYLGNWLDGTLNKTSKFTFKAK